MKAQTYKNAPDNYFDHCCLVPFVLFFLLRRGFTACPVRCIRSQVGVGTGAATKYTCISPNLIVAGATVSQKSTQMIPDACKQQVASFAFP